MLELWEMQYSKFLEPFREDQSSPTGPIVRTKKFAEEIYSSGLWYATKMWELINGNDLEGMGKTLYGAKAEERSWPGIYRHVFNVSPNLSNIPRLDSLSFNNRMVNHTYLSNMWYHVQPVLNSGNSRGGGFYVVDWAYAHGNLNDLRKDGSNPKVAEPGRQLILFVKQMQEKHQNSKGAGAEDPWSGWEVFRDHPLYTMVEEDTYGV